MTSAPRPNVSVRIAVLGCGNVGSALVGILQDRADALAVQSGARLEVAGIAVNDLSRPRAPHVPRRPAHRRRRRRWWPTRRSTWSSSSSAAWSRPGQLVRSRPRSGQAGGDRQQGAAGLARGRRPPGPGQGAGGRPALRGRRGRRHPPGAGAARVADRRADPPGDGHRQRDHQLHPDQDGRAGRRLRRGAGRGPGAGPGRARSRPPTSRGSTPRPRRPSWPAWPSGTTWPAPT